MDKQFAERSKIRNEETNAVSQALEILTDDDARDPMSRSRFLQTSMRVSSNIRERASSIPKTVGQKTGSTQLSALALAMKNDVFGNIKDSIDLMVTQSKG